jgi:putative restriction endonuclease
VNIQEFINEVEVQPTYQAEGRRWPHKRLTLMLGIGTALRGERLVPYREFEGPLSDLLVRFGPNTSPNPQDPVWRLRRRNGMRTRIWEVRNADRVQTDRSDNPRVSELREHTSVGLSEEAARLFTDQPEAAIAVARWIAESIVPETLEDELIAATLGEGEMPSAGPHQLEMPVELRLIERDVVLTRRAVRDRSFAPRVLQAYEHVCAVCSLSPALDGQRFGLEAAHIRWANHRGPDAVQNGICLCRMHHVALDRGALTIDRDMQVRIADGLERNEQSEDAFHRFDRQKIRLPRMKADAPDSGMLEWHHAEVFRGRLV